MKKVLVTGNGFDIAHGLKTKYKDFIDFVDQFVSIFELNEISEEYLPMHTNEFNDFIVRFFREDNEENNGIIQEFYRLTHDNIWIQHFKRVMATQNENWVDFEKEISSIVRMLENSFDKQDCNENAIVSNFVSEPLFHDYLNTIRDERSFVDIDGFKRFIIEDCLSYLNCLIRAFEIYLEIYVIKCPLEGIYQKNILDLALNGDDCIITFNYIDTYNKIYSYDTKEKILVHHIHGNADIKNTVDSNKMVLGIDEYLNGEDRNRKTDFVRFKKYFQRIIKQTDATYKSIFSCDSEINMDSSDKIEVYFFGHSLDVTDKDIISEIVTSNKVSTITIFAYDKKTQESQISNLIQIIGMDRLINDTYSDNPRIFFKIQENM